MIIHNEYGWMNDNSSNDIPAWNSCRRHQINLIYKWHIRAELTPNSQATDISHLSQDLHWSDKTHGIIFVILLVSKYQIDIGNISLRLYSQLEGHNNHTLTIKNTKL